MSSAASEPINESHKNDIISTLPTSCQDDLVSILQWLPVKKLIQLERVCHEWQDVIIPMSYAKTNQKSFVLDDFVSSQLPWRSNDGNIDRCYIFYALLDRLGLHLTSIVLPDMGSDRQFVSEILQLLPICPNLKHLDTGDTLLTSEMIPLLPTTIDSIKMNSPILEPSVLMEFFRTHPGLKKLRMSANWQYPYPNVPKWLAQYCPGLTNLSLYMDSFGRGFTPMFEDVFPSLSYLNEFELGTSNCFKSDDLEELCVNCHDLEVLKLKGWETPQMTNVMSILQLKKIKRLDLQKFVLTDQSVAAWCEGVGVTLEYFQLCPNSLTDVSLHAIGQHCHNMADLRFYYGDENKFTQEGMVSLIEAITSSPCWNESSKHRQLSVASRLPGIFGKVKLNKYDDRVVLKIYDSRICGWCGYGGGYHVDSNNEIELIAITDRDLRPYRLTMVNLAQGDTHLRPFL